MDPKDEARQQVLAFLDRSKQSMGMMSVDFIVTNVRIFVPTASKLTESELRATVSVWRTINGPNFTLSTPPPAAPADTKLKETAKNAVTSKTDEPEVEHDGGKINITIGGPTAELKKGDLKLSAGISWGGTLSVGAEKGIFHFSGELSKDRWQITLSFPEDTFIPDLSKLGKTITDGESSMRSIVGATAGFKNLSDIPRLKDTVSPHIQPVSDAVDALQSIAKAPPKGGWSAGVTFGSPDPQAGQTGMPGGIQGQFVVTFRF